MYLWVSVHWGLCTCRRVVARGRPALGGIRAPGPLFWAVLAGGCQKGSYLVTASQGGGGVVPAGVVLCCVVSLASLALSCLRVVHPPAPPPPPLVASLPLPGGCRPVLTVYSSINLPVLTPVFGRFCGVASRGFGRCRRAGVVLSHSLRSLARGSCLVLPPGRPFGGGLSPRDATPPPPGQYRPSTGVDLGVFIEECTTCILRGLAGWHHGAIWVVAGGGISGCGLSLTRFARSLGWSVVSYPPPRSGIAP